MFYQIALLPFDVRNFENTYGEVLFLAKLRLEAYSFTKNELLPEVFQIISLRFKVFAFYD